MDLWDETKALSRAFRTRGNFGDALDAVEKGERGIRVGVNVEVSRIFLGEGLPGKELEADLVSFANELQIPKCQKGTAVRASLMQFQKAGSRLVYAETKYDGERCVPPLLLEPLESSEQ